MIQADTRTAVPADPRRLILASTSPYRRELLGRLRLPFDVVAPQVDETPLPGESPEATALRLAEAKARAVAEDRNGCVVIGSDQVATLDGQQIGKPGTHAAALAQLRIMRGREVAFHTALCVVDTGTQAAERADVITHVRFRDLADAELEAYLLAEQPYDVAGSAKSEALGIALLESMRSDDPTALVGLPLIALCGMLRAIGFPILTTDS
ncbi:Maf family nucleotide pyrophosphatase [Chitinasiproducens palmae]|uniref:7-methyl-GTP pyrophosphatase n=1 Tax=Chitinasiproducens palmae TaxID=1770053 RepID=A0A1H2PVL9_9BURK|nr:Maf family nucleotide pyrophosphatase [Chitinasiproducens palmae]SDV50976.1 septum formation protein [Chitinasiproducens palmae]